MRFPRFVALGGAIAALVLLLAVVLFVRRDVVRVEIMEARNLITAHEMITTGHWWQPTMLGEPRLAKPPLPTWLTATAMLLGASGADTNLNVDRFPSALAGLFLALCLFGLTRFWTKDTATALWSTAFLATSYMFVLMARRNTWDIYAHAFMLAAIWAVAVILATPGYRPRLALLAGSLMGLSGLSKGPVSFYALLLPFFAAHLATGAWPAFRRHWRELALALALGLFLSVIWPVSVWLTTPQAVVQTISVERAAWFTAHTKPFWFYLQFPLMTGVWVLVACAALWGPHARGRVEPALPFWRFLAWVLMGVGLLMLVPEKKGRYLLPVLIPLCPLMGAYLAGLLRDPDKGGRIGCLLVLGNTILFSLIAIAASVALWWLRLRFPAVGVLDTLAVTALVLLFLILFFRLHRAKDLHSLFLAKFAFIGLLVLLPLLAHLPAGDMSVPLTEIRTFTADVPVVQDMSLNFQDFWVIGSRPLNLNDQNASSLPDQICFATREDPTSLPAALSTYEQRTHLDVSNLTGKTLHLVGLWRSPAP